MPALAASSVIPIINGVQLPLPKPRWGSACTGCGVCCATQPCKVAQELLDCQEGPCVALEVADGRTYCGLVRNPVRYLMDEEVLMRAAPDVVEAAAGQLSVHIAGVLRLGAGCDADD